MRRPAITGTTHVLPFDKLSPADFERLCLWLVEREGYERAEHLGAAGKDQGRDIVAWRGSTLWAFQCKRVRKFGPQDVVKEVNKVLALPEGKRPAHLAFLVTCNVTDNTRQRACERCGDRMECHFWPITELDERVKHHPDILEEFFVEGDRNIQKLVKGLKKIGPWGCVTGIVILSIVVSAIGLVVDTVLSPPRVPTARKLHYFIILDASDRMKDGLSNGESKWSVARDVVHELLEGALPSGASYGLIALGGDRHSVTHGCDQTPEPVVPLGLNRRSDVLAAIDRLRPRGTASLCEAISRARDELLQLPDDHEKTIVIITGGGDACSDPQNNWIPIIDIFQLFPKSLSAHTDLVILTGEEVSEETRSHLQRIREIRGVQVSEPSNRTQAQAEIEKIGRTARERARVVQPAVIAAEETQQARMSPHPPTATPTLETRVALILTKTDDTLQPGTLTPTPLPTRTLAAVKPASKASTTTKPPTSEPAPSRTPTRTRIPTKTSTPSGTPAATSTPTFTPSPSKTPTVTSSPTNIPTATSTKTLVPTPTPEPSWTPTSRPSRTPTPTATPTPEVTYDYLAHTITVHPGSFERETGRLCKAKLADVGRQAVFLSSDYLYEFGEPAGLWATITHSYPSKGVDVTLQDIEVGQYSDIEVNADGKLLNYSNCVLNLTQQMRQELSLPEELGEFNDLARFDHGTISISLSSSPACAEPQNDDVEAGIFAASDQSEMADLAINFREFYTATAALNGSATTPGSNDDTAYRIAYDRITPVLYACWGIVLPELDVSNLSRLAFDIKGQQGGELPNVWLASSGSPSDIRNFVDIEDYLTVTNAWQRVEIPLIEFHAKGETEETVDLTRIVRLQICFEWADMAGMVFVDGFAFE